jgi:hypothetical protein
MYGVEHMRLLSIESKHFVAGLEFDQSDRVVRTAPILAYMKNWTIRRVLDYARMRKWTVSNASNGRPDL